MARAARVPRPAPLPGVRAETGPSRRGGVARALALQSACGHRAFAQIVAAQIQRDPAEPWADQRLWEGELGTAATKRPVKAFYFPGTTARRALVIAGVHGSERQGSRGRAC